MAVGGGVASRAYLRLGEPRRASSIHDLDYPMVFSNDDDDDDDYDDDEDEDDDCAVKRRKGTREALSHASTTRQSAVPGAKNSAVCRIYLST